MKLMLQFGKVQSWGLMRSIEYSSQVFGWPKFPQPSEWTNFPHATLCVWLNEMMALEVVTDSKNDKTKKNDL